MGLDAERAAVEEAAVALLGLGRRIEALADVDWHSPAAVLYRASVADLAGDCAALGARLAAHVPAEP